MKRSFLFPVLLVPILFAGQTLAEPGSENGAVLGPDRAVLIDVEGWPHFNWSSFDQDKVVSFNGFQYSVFWDAQRVLTLVRRDLETDDIQVLPLSDHVLAQGRGERYQRDGHRNTVVGISPGDGRLHLSWDHHNDDLNYTKSREGFLTDPPATIAPDDFEPKQSLTERDPSRVTYPRFLNDEEGNLFFFYRSGGSGAGDVAFFEYDHAKGEWHLISERLFGREGVFPGWENSPSRNAYMHDLLFDDSGRLHITWVYREKSSTWASNHDLHYAYSDDEGRSWRNNAGELIADTRKGEQILLDSPGIRVREIPVFSWIMNQCGMTVDSKNRPHVATFHREEPFVPEEIGHHPPPEAREGFRYFHYWRGDDGAWHRSQPLPMPGGLRRPMIVATPDDAIVIYFSTSAGFQAYLAQAEDDWEEWRHLRLTGPEFRVNDISKPDRNRLREENVLSFTVDPRGGKEGSAFGFLDFDLSRIAEE